ncbi:MAG TPA: hypothetical protein VN924_02880 [Bryobacteraceae bacterium]|nr:hypothetical protein [Bryobacteraceae bacterium]
MDLTRYWRAQHNGSNIEVQWTGFRSRGGWTLRLLVNGELKAEHKVRRWAKNFEIQDGSVTVNFWGKLFRNRCTISAGGTLLTDRTQPWNPLAFAVIFAPLGLYLILALCIVLHAAS